MYSESEKVTTYATIRDIAKLANTSIATVSYVLNNSKERYISDEMRARVLDAAKELNYVKNGLASSLKDKKRGVIAFLTPQFENHFFVSIFSAIEEIASLNGYVISTCNTFDHPRREREVLERMIRIRADGYLIIPTHEGTRNTAYIRERNLPFVSIERPLDGISEYDFVSSDNFNAAYLLTQHLIDNGHRKISLVYWDSPVSNLHERLHGYKQALLDNGLEFDPTLVKSGDITHEEGARITEEILRDPEITAVVYGQYIFAEGGIKYLRKNNVDIPGRLSVVLVGHPKWVELNDLQFTCVVQPGEQIGKEAAKIIFNYLNAGDVKEQAEQFVQKKFPCTLRSGDSVKKI